MDTKPIAEHLAQALHSSPGRILYNNCLLDSFNGQERLELIQHLKDLNIQLYPNTGDGAFLCTKDEDRMTITKIEGRDAVVWTDKFTGTVIIFPLLKVEKL